MDDDYTERKGGIMNLFKKYKAKKAAEVQERKSRLEQCRINAEGALDERRKEMLSRFCAVRGDDVCTAGCVHWRKGHVFYFLDCYYIASPICRLWGSK